MSQRRRVERIKDASERTIEGLVTKEDEFVYEYTGGRVPKDKIYSTFFTSDKAEIYMTGIMNSNNNKIILKINDDSIINKYKKTKNVTRQDYPETQAVSPDNTDYNTGSVVRYFAQKANNLDGEIFEIKEEDNEINNLFRYIVLDWRIGGLKSDVIRDNQVTIDLISRTRGNEQFRKILSPLQYWNPPKGSVDDIQAKLNRRKIM